LRQTLRAALADAALAGAPDTDRVSELVLALVRELAPLPNEHRESVGELLLWLLRHDDVATVVKDL
jgi:hypothetical protein